ncbi:MAG: glycoside hydrolase family 2 protein [Paludibacter sp.]|nr:glycoside hydrolase family 2 protein [Paludibacter sp.]
MKFVCSNVNKFVVSIIFMAVYQTNIAQSITTYLPLSSNWEMREASTRNWFKAIVPGCVHSDLFRNKLIPDPYYRTNEKQLQWIDKKDWEYKTTFNLPEELFKSEHLELVFEGLDTFSDVYLNDQKVLTTDNMFREWTADIRKYIVRGENRIRIYFHSPIDAGLKLLKDNGYMLLANNDQAINGGLLENEVLAPFIRKAGYHFGWDWGPRFVTSGIWCPVYLRAWNNFKINDVYIQQTSLTDELATLSGEIEIESSKIQHVNIQISTKGIKPVNQTVELQVGKNTFTLPIKIKNPKRWWTNGLGKPNLYIVTAKVQSKNAVDMQSKEIGLRTLKLIQKPDSGGHTFYFELNGVPVFAKGENHIPNDMFADRMTKEVYDWEINTAVKSNLNMLRVWGGGIYENDYFYQLCNRNGILIWQDFMFACALYPGNQQFLNSVTEEAKYQIKRLRNHPSIALWCGNNEIDQAWQNFDTKGGWGWKEKYNENQKKQIWIAYDTLFKHILPEIAKRLMPETAYWHSSPTSILPTEHSGNTNKNGDVHYWGVWWGKDPFEKFADNIGRFMSEYGFQSFPELETIKKYALPEDYDIESDVMRHHQRSSIGNKTIKLYMDKYYREPKDFEKFIYVGQVLQAYGIQFAIEAHRRAMPYNMGTLVWQINDCWPVASWSSCDYYHRWKALQYEIKRSFEPIIISAYSNAEFTNISIVSDRLSNISAQLEMTVCNFNGKVLQHKSVPVMLKSNSVTKLANEKTKDLTQNSNGNYLILKLKANNTTLAQNIFFFAQPKNLDLTKPKIISKIEKCNKEWNISLKTNVLAKNIYLNFPDTEGFFSDNYFDLLPGEEYKITFTPNNKTAKLPPLSLMSLVDSYN